MYDMDELIDYSKAMDPEEKVHMLANEEYYTRKYGIRTLTES